jgi:hypothetical protein
LRFAFLGGRECEDRFRYLTKKLHIARQIAARYSAHDLSHEFEVKVYQKTCDI